MEYAFCWLCPYVAVVFGGLYLWPTGGIDQCGLAFCIPLAVKVPSVWDVTNISKKGKEPSGLASCAAIWMEGSTVLMCWKNSSLCDCC